MLMRAARWILVLFGEVVWRFAQEYFGNAEFRRDVDQAFKRKNEATTLEQKKEASKQIRDLFDRI